MGWNHRVLAHESEGEVYLQIHEVYYDDDGKPNGYTQNAVIVGSVVDIHGIKWTLMKMTECLEKPILYAGERFPEEYKK